MSLEGTSFGCRCNVGRFLYCLMTEFKFDFKRKQLAIPKIKFKKQKKNPFNGFAKINTREIFLKRPFAKINTREIYFFFRFAKINTREN